VKLAAAMLAPAATSLVAVSAVSGGAAPTAADVAPIFAGTCAGCHTIGGVAPFALTSAADAKSHAVPIEAAT
jgi:mono/diheme cytochrome c family protein